MDNELRQQIRKYYQDEYGKVIPKHISIDKFINNVIDPERPSLQLFWLKRFLILNPNTKILDYGAGLGDFVIFLRKKGFESFGFEVDKRLYDISVKRVQEVEMCPFLYSKEGNIPVPDNYYDIVYSNFVLEHVQNLENYFKEAIRVVKPQGTVLITTCNYKLGYEFHYALWLPLFSRRLSKLVLKIMKRDPKFLDSLNFITPSKLGKVVKTLSKELNIEVSDEGKRIFRKDLFDETVHSLRFRKIAKVVEGLGMMKLIEKLDIYNPMVICIRKVK